MLGHFGWRSMLAIAISTGATTSCSGASSRRCRANGLLPDVEIACRRGDAGQQPAADPAWVTAVHLGFMAWTVVNAHYPALFVGGFLFFLGFARATAAYQTLIDIKTPLLVGFFLAGLVVHGGLQGGGLRRCCRSLSETPLFWGATLLTAFNDNALITYLATLVPNLSDPLKIAVVEGAVTGGGLTVIANAPNPAGQALLGRLLRRCDQPDQTARSRPQYPTLMAAATFRLL